VKYKKIQLKNGLSVLFIESNKSPVISVQMWVRTGSADETPSERGISHFIEHLVFKGTPSFKVGEIAKTVEGCGGELNAYTSFDQTVYYVTMPSSETSTAIKVIHEMTSCPNFDQLEVDNEREVVIEEIKRGLDSPGRVASQLLFSTVYKKHPYGIPVIGYEKIIKRVPLKTLKSYFNGRYHPKNMFLVVAGNISSKDLSRELKAFAEPMLTRYRNVKRPKEPSQKTSRLKVQKSTFQDNFIHFGFRIPSAKHKDIPALEAMAMILGQGDSSRLVHRLRIEKHLANSIGASIFSPNGDGLFLVSGTFKQEKLEEMLAEIIKSIDEARNSLVTVDELTKVKVNIESEQYFSLETVDGLSRSLGSWEFLFKDPSHFEKYLDQIQKLTPEDLVRAARKWLVPETLTVVSLTQDTVSTQKTIKAAVSRLKTNLRLEKGASHLLKQQARSPKTKSMKKIPLSVNAPQTEVIDLPSGARLLLRKIQETPLISVKAAFAGGMRAEPSDRRSITELVSRTWIGDIEHLKEADVYQFFDSRAAAIGSFSGRNSVGLNTDMLKPFEKDCGNLWSKLLVTPSFQESILEREKSVLTHQIQSRNDKGAQRAIMKLQEILFQGHPYQFDLLGTEESVAAVTTVDLKSYWKKIASAENLVVSVSGNIDVGYWKSLVQGCTESLQKGERISKSYTARPPKEPTTHHQTLNREQTHIAIGFPGLSLKNPDRYTLQIIDSILSGQGGRLFLELRDKNSLAYSVGPIHMEGLETGYFGAYIGCSPEKTERAIDMLFAEFQRLVKEPVSQDELQKARRYIIGRHHIEMQRTSHVNSLILFDALYDLDIDEAFELDSKYNAITPKDIQRVAKEIFSLPPVICTVGPNPNVN
jgi:zinc protease